MFQEDYQITVEISIPEGCAFFLVTQQAIGFFLQLSQDNALFFIQTLPIIPEPIKENKSNELIKKVEEGLTFYEPELCEEGVNGTYFLKNKEGKCIGVFKPMDEEGSSENNPKRSEENKDLFVNRGIKEGEAAVREIAAFLLDKDHFSGVPETVMASLPFPTKEKTGSLQSFVENDGSSEDRGVSTFPVREVHKIGILDMRIFNNDRHGGNILVKENEDGRIELIPIDHGLSLSSSLKGAWFDWLFWPQSKVPFDEETKRYIDSIDIEADANLLRSIGISEECIRTMIISTTLLKKGASCNLSLFQIASMVCRLNDLENPSALEMMVQKAKETTQGDDENEFFKSLWSIMDAELKDSLPRM